MKAIRSVPAVLAFAAAILSGVRCGTTEPSTEWPLWLSVYGVYSDEAGAPVKGLGVTAAAEYCRLNEDGSWHCGEHIFAGTTTDGLGHYSLRWHASCVPVALTAAPPAAM
jgi:hypothetical protein